MSQPLRVLLLEDNPALGESIEFALTTFGLTVCGSFASNARSLEFLGQNVPDVAILDLDLGNETSVLTADRLREMGIPFLFTSGHDMDEEIPPGFQNEMCLPKPVAPEVLVEALQELSGSAMRP